MSEVELIEYRPTNNLHPSGYEEMRDKGDAPTLHSDISREPSGLVRIYYSTTKLQLQ